MGGGGGGLLGTVLSIASFVPGLQFLKPIAIAINMANAVNSGNPVGMITSAFGAGNYLSGAGAFGGDFGVSDSFNGDPYFDYGSGTDLDLSGGINPALSNAVMEAPDFFGEGSIGAVSDYSPGLIGDGSLANVYSTGGDTFGELQGLMNGEITQEAFDRATQNAPGVIANDMRLNYLTGPDAGNMDAALAGARGDLESLFSGASNAPDMGGYFGNVENSFSNLFGGPGGLETQYNTITDMGQGINEMQSAAPQIADISRQFGSPLGTSQTLTGSDTTAIGGDGVSTAAIGGDQIGAMNQPTNPDTYGVTDQGQQWSNLGNDKSWAGYVGEQPQSASSVNLAGNNPDEWGTTEGIWSSKNNPYVAGNNPDEWGNTARVNNGGRGMNLGDLFKPREMSTMRKLVTGGAGLWQDYNTSKALDEMKDHYRRAMEGSDQFAKERGIASNKWTEAAQNPDSVYQQYMAGQGGLDLRNAAAAYAKAGRRNMLPTLQTNARMNMMANYLPQHMKMFNPTQFKGDQSRVESAFAPNLASLYQQRGMGTAGALGKIMKNSSMIEDMFA